MIGSAIKRTLVQGGAGLGRDAREGRPRDALGDGFADSISSALERLVSPTTRTRTVPFGMEASVAPIVQATDDEAGNEPAASGDANLLEAQERWGASAPWARDVRRLEAKTISTPSQIYAASAGGMAVWEGAGGEVHAPFSEPPVAAPFLEGTASEPLATLATQVVRELDAEPMPLVTKRAHLGEDGIRTRPTRPEELRGEPALSGSGSPVARVGTVRVGSPDVRERVARLRPPSADVPSPLPSELAPTRVASARHDEREVPAERRRGAEREHGTERMQSSSGSHARASRDERDGRSEGSGHERGHRDPASARSGRGSESDAERPFASVHTVPLVSIGDTGGATSTGVTAAPLGAMEPNRLGLPIEGAAANGPSEAARTETVPYQVVRLDDRTARVELMHPELGRVQVEVHTDQGRVDVELLARSLSASIALRASEPELRGDLRQRGASLRNYRVRTASDEAARALDERQR
jgi:hypothetical protein